MAHYCLFSLSLLEQIAVVLARPSRSYLLLRLKNGLCPNIFVVNSFRRFLSFNMSLPFFHPQVAVCGSPTFITTSVQLADRICPPCCQPSPTLVSALCPPKTSYCMLCHFLRGTFSISELFSEVHSYHLSE